MTRPKRADVKIKHGVYQYMGWHYRYVPMTGYVADRIDKPKASSLVAGTVQQIERKIKNHWHTWGW